ncbi:uncharacterized protein LOC141640971 [Silene latifolia]|uniref:uncharacterized protein LOC141640971 n=1 Tax=Silene latifolia TaxID=37657 RepID=UPI003D77F9E5
MARNSSAKTIQKRFSRIGKIQTQRRESFSQRLNKGKGPSETDEVRSKSLHEINGIPGLSFEDEDSIAENSKWITKRGKKAKQLVEEEEEVCLDNLIQFSSDDTKDEISYLNNAVVCFVLGANPPWDVLHGYIHRIWGKYGIDKVSFLPNGVFLVRLKETKGKETVLTAGYHMFDNKHLIVRPWKEDIELTKEDVKVVPAWIRLHELPLRFWGKWLPTIAGLAGKYVKSDQATNDKTRLGFARVMIELNVGQKCPKQVKFMDEAGAVVSIKNKYEWRPDICLKCKGIGHTGDQCRKTDLTVKKKYVTKQVWQPVAPVAATTTESVDVATDELATSTNATVTEPVAMTVTEPEQATELVVVDSPEHTPIKQAIVQQEEPDSVKTTGKTYLQALDGSLTPKSGIGTETKINNNNVFNIANNMLDGWSVTTNCHYHKGGRVWILWQPSLFDVQILQYDAQFIHTKVHSRVSQHDFYLTMIYAFNEGCDRLDLWQKLEVINLNCTGPWALVGDFNTVLSPDERLGGNTKQEDMDDFINCMGTCGMTDIASTGALFTWNNKQDYSTRIYSRLDRFLVNQAWLDIYPDMVAHFYPEGLFDHCPCIVSNIKSGATKNASFKYFNMWGQAPGFKDKVGEVWGKHYEGYKMFSLVKRLKSLKAVLKSLNLECYSDIENKTLLAEKRLEGIQKEIART